MLRELVAPSILLFEFNAFLKCDDSATRHISVGSLALNLLYILNSIPAAAAALPPRGFVKVALSDIDSAEAPHTDSGGNKTLLTLLNSAPQTRCQRQASFTCYLPQSVHQPALF